MVQYKICKIRLFRVGQHVGRFLSKLCELASDEGMLNSLKGSPSFPWVWVEKPVEEMGECVQ